MNYNFIYMFKNPIRFFLNISSFDYEIDGTEELSLKQLAWTEPVDFIIRRHYDNDALRILRLPNLLNFYNMYLKIKSDPYFDEIDNVSTHSRMKVNLKSGDFAAFNYKKNLELDLHKLTEYDCLIKLDIKSFYDSIYTHHLQQECSLDFTDAYISNNNLGSTKGILMGSYVSLFLAEKYLSIIAQHLNEELNRKNIENVIKYFSDDFYIFTNNSNINNVKYTFSLVLSEFGLIDNSNKMVVYNYINYRNENKIDKYWSEIIHNQKIYQDKINKISQKLANKKVKILYKMNFLDQLVCIKGMLSSQKSQAILINGFFKSNFFINLNPNDYSFGQTELHQTLYLCREHPEIILYVSKKFKNYRFFQTSSKKFFKSMYEKSLQKPYHEEQIYFFYGCLNLFGSKFLITPEFVDLVSKTENQIPKSYYLQFGLLDNRLEKFLDNNENKWFFNYHLIERLYKIDNDIDVDKYIKKHLIPKACKNNNCESYLKFYKKNIIENNLMINLDIDNSIADYLKLKEAERKKYNI